MEINININRSDINELKELIDLVAHATSKHNRDIADLEFELKQINTKLEEKS